MSQNTFSMAGGVARNPLVRLAKPITATIGAMRIVASDSVPFWRWAGPT